MAGIDSTPLHLEQNAHPVKIAIYRNLDDEVLSIVRPDLLNSTIPQLFERFGQLAFCEFSNNMGTRAFHCDLPT